MEIITNKLNRRLVHLSNDRMKAELIDDKLEYRLWENLWIGMADPLQDLLWSQLDGRLYNQLKKDIWK